MADITQRFEYLEARMAEGSGDLAAVGREYAELRPVAEQVAEWRRLGEARAEAEAMLADPEMTALAREELLALESRQPEVEAALRLALLPKDAADARPAIIEIRPGTGGEEAALFAGDLLRMYQRYAERRGWRWQPVETAETERGGVREAIVNIAGEGVFARLKFELGVHRVQRVPETEVRRPDPHLGGDRRGAARGW